jgi:hypothetical protein
VFYEQIQMRDFQQAVDSGRLGGTAEGTAEGDDGLDAVDLEGDLHANGTRNGNGQGGR